MRTSAGQSVVDSCRGWPSLGVVPPPASRAAHKEGTGTGASLQLRGQHTEKTTLDPKPTDLLAADRPTPQTHRKPLPPCPKSPHPLAESGSPLGRPPRITPPHRLIMRAARSLNSACRLRLPFRRSAVVPTHGAGPFGKTGRSKNPRRSKMASLLSGQGRCGCVALD